MGENELPVNDTVVMDSVGGNEVLEGDAASSSLPLPLTGGLLGLVQRSFLSDLGHTSRLCVFVHGWNELRMKQNPLGLDAKSGREFLTNTRPGRKVNSWSQARKLLLYSHSVELS